MEELSVYQANVLKKMKEDNLFLWTDEGVDYKIWLGDSSASKLFTVNRKSGESLERKGMIKGVDDKLAGRGYYKYILTEKASKYI